MTPKRPYLLRALYEWIVDNDLTPHLVVDATIVGTVVPQNFVSEGQILLNISPTAVQGLQLADHEVRFNARFGGQPMQVVVPMTAALAIYARENGAGAMFEAEPELEGEEPASDEAEQKPAKKKPNLKVVK
ncbi:ClpXP protease specificity-enhancing factor [Idiomarina loihiensis]|uniref:ClpXP protease specificity-enhancing factor n=1 Tax=Idiomarina loihiensis TaxID=135577 RepID=UPI0039BDDD68